MFGPVIVGERITLAPMTPELLPQYVEWFANTEITRYLGISNCPTLDMEREWYERMAKSDTDIVWAILLEGRHIGTTALHAISWKHRRAITGNVIGDKSEWGKGYGSEAVRLRTAYAFTELPLEKLETEAFADNIGSRRCLEKAGYRQYGVARRHVWRGGKWHDMWLADILRDEWQELQAQAR